ncbi:MAG: insulinase family protein, partial [Ruminococcus flavefaciens]|nr:insulinase family protein [Ruminococcus flavefaciens]
MKRILYTALALMAGLTGLVAQAQVDPMKPIEADKEIRTGVLPNGLTYYIRHNEKPKDMANFYIVHDVGAIQEDDSQQGLAHFLEHMAFNGTKNFPKKTLIEYLEKVGVKFGANLNAFTSWDLTQYYMSDVPTLREGVIDSALLILHDWSHFIALQPEEIDSERGVIMEELRTRDGASWRSTIDMLKTMGKGTKYAERNLIGYLDGLKSFSHDDLESFYNKWYRPDYQAVVVVGDIDVDAIENKIKALMADIPAPAANAARKEVITVPDNDEPIVSVFADPEMQASQLQILYKQPAMPKQYKGLVAAEMVDIVSSYISLMMNERLNDIARKPDAPFLGASFSPTGSFGICPTLDVTGGSVRTADGKITEGYKALLTEMERMRRYGFTEGEYERAKNELLSSIETQYNSRDDRRHDSFADRCIDNFRLGEPIPDAQTEHDLDKLLVEMIDLDMINKTVQSLYDPLKNAVIMVRSPKKEGVAIPSEQELADILKASVTAEVEAFEDNTVKEPLIGDEAALKGSPVKKTSVNGNLGTTEWTLKNGIKVVVKQTPFEADRVSLTAVSDGGTALFGDELYYSASMLPSVMNMSGISKFSASDLRKQLSGKVASAGSSVGQYKHTVSGSSSLKDLETMLQLVYLQFTAPRFSEDDFATLMKRYESMLANQMSNPDFIFGQNVTKTLYGDSYRRQQLTPEILATVKLEQMAGIHKRLYSNAADFQFRIIGNIDPQTLQPLVEKYIGSLPAAKKPANRFTDDGVRPVSGKVDNNFTAKMEQPKVSVFYAFTGDIDYNLKNRMTMTY